MAADCAAARETTGRVDGATGEMMYERNRPAAMRSSPDFCTYAQFWMVIAFVTLFVNLITVLHGIRTHAQGDPRCSALGTRHSALGTRHSALILPLVLASWAKAGDHDPVCLTCETTTGNYCSTMVRPGTTDAYGASCGASAAVTIAQTIGHQFQVRCGDAAYTFTIQSTAGSSCGCTAPPCGTCKIKMCWPNSSVSVITCTEWYRVFIPTGDYTCGIPLGEWEWRSRERTTATFHSGGTQVCTSEQSDSSCFCKALGHNCECPPASTAPTPETQGAVSSHTPFTALAIDLRQFDDSIALLGTISSLEEASLQQRVSIRATVEYAIEHAPQMPDFVTLCFSDGSLRTEQPFAVLSELDGLVSSAAAGTARLDLDGDGVIDENDSVLFDLLANASTSLDLGISRLDVNGDFSVDAEDDCEIVMNRGTLATP